MKITKLFRSLTIPACLTALAAVFPQVVPANAADSARVSLDDDWRFIRNDPSGITDNLTYPRAPRTDRRGSAATNATAAFSPTSGIAQYILPTGNNFIADPAKRYPKPDGNYGGEIPYVNPSFDDSGWKQLDLPQDFAIEGPFIPPGQAGSDGATGRLPYFGVAWYRKHLSVPAADAGKQFYLDIDGAMSYAKVWCNGQIVGGWPYGYASWRVDLTPYDQVWRGQCTRHPAGQSRRIPRAGIPAAAFTATSG